MNTHFFRIATLCLVSVSTASALACSPPLPVQHQRHQLTTALGSEAFGTALAPLIEKDPLIRIASVTFQEGVLVTLSNDCTIRLSLKYLPPEDPGMCPRLDRVEAQTTCP
jgi:hypothetical protein